MIRLKFYTRFDLGWCDWGVQIVVQEDRIFKKKNILKGIKNCFFFFSLLSMLTDQFGLTKAYLSWKGTNQVLLFLFPDELWMEILRLPLDSLSFKFEFGRFGPLSVCKYVCMNILALLKKICYFFGAVYQTCKWFLLFWHPESMFFEIIFQNVKNWPKLVPKFTKKMVL